MEIFNLKSVPFFAPNIFFLKSLAMYVCDDNWNVAQKFLYYAWRTIYVSTNISVLVLIVLDLKFREKYEKISDIAMNIMYIEIFFSNSVRSLYYIFNLDKVKDLVMRGRREFKASAKYSLQPDTTEKATEFNRVLFKYWMIFVYWAAIIMVVGPVIRGERILILPLYTPYNWKVFPYFEITYFIHSIILLFMVVTLGNLDMTYSTFMLAIAEQYRILGVDFGGVFDDALLECGCTEDDINNRRRIGDIVETQRFRDLIKENFKDCVQRHQILIEYFDDFQDLMSFLLLVEINFTFCYLIFTLFVFLTNSNTSMLLALSQYFMGSVMQIALITFVGSNFETNVELMRSKLYNFPWYLCGKDFLVDYKFVQLKLSRHVTIKAGNLIELNCELFLEFMKKAFSFFTVLRQMNQPDN